MPYTDIKCNETEDLSQIRAVVFEKNAKTA